MKKKGRLLTLLLAVLLVISAVPAMTWAEEDENAAEETIVETVVEESNEEEETEIVVEVPAEEEKHEDPAPEEKPAAEEAPVQEEIIEEAPVEEETIEEEKIEEMIEAEAEVIVDTMKTENTKAAQESFKVTLYFVTKDASGNDTTASESNTLTSGMGWNFTQKKLDNKVKIKKFSCNGTKYEYTGSWTDQNGNLITPPISIKGKDLDGDIDLYYYAVYNEIKVAHLDFRYIDNISTGSGSWSNTDDFTSHTHTFKQPADAAHYRFITWHNTDNGQDYAAGDKVTYYAKDIDPQTGKNVVIYAMWQPSVTVNYHDEEGNLINSVETYENHSLYSYELSDEGFMGWCNELGGEILSSDTAYASQEPVSERVAQTIINVYAAVSASYDEEHYIELLDGSWSLKEDKTVSGTRIDTKVAAEEKTYEGFTRDDSVEGSLAEAVMKKGLVLKVYYTRNSYKVTYDYGEAPDGASALPEEQYYLFEEEVKVAEDAYAEAYDFSGWDREDFTMPAGDVIITGSWSLKTFTVTWVNADGSLLELDEEVPYGSMPSFDGNTPVRKKDKNYTYSFAGWTPQIEEVTQDVTYTATYKKTRIPADVVEPETPDTPETPEPEQPSIPETPADIPDEPEMEIAEAPVPLAQPEEIVIAEAAVPEAIPEIRSWALINLISAIVTVLTALAMVITFFRKKKEDDEEENQEERKQERTGSKFLGLLPAVISVVLFILTEDMRNPMVLWDRYTIWMLVIAVINFALAWLTRNRKEDEEEEKQEYEEALSAA